MVSLEKRVLEALIEIGDLDESSLKKAATIAEKENLSLQSAIVGSGLASEKQFLHAVAKVASLRRVTKLADESPDEEVIECIGVDFLVASSALPLQKTSGVREIAIAEPLNTELLQILEFSLEESVRPVVAERSTIQEVLEQYQVQETNRSGTSELIRSDDQATLTALANEAPVVRYVQAAISEGIERQASDVHFESAERAVALRYRINGKLTERKFSREIDPASVLSRLKVLADLNVSERSLPQDGRISFIHASKAIDLRVSTLPSHVGESAVVRILDRSTLKLDWQALGFREQDIGKLQQLTSLPNGMVIVTGPTGSGKTTTLYTALDALNSTDRKLITVEDPVEFDLPGIVQVSVRPHIGLSFGKALRAILRQDPNVIMIGEIRDLETAEIACRAALVGRLVLATLHTNSAEQARTRLLDLGVAEYLVDATLRGVIAQTLDALDCTACSGFGCEACGGSGAEGRKLNYQIVTYEPK